jgi:hypothetical protein
VLVAVRCAGQGGTYGTYHRRNYASSWLPIRILRNPVVIGTEEVAMQMQMATDGSIHMSSDTAHGQKLKITLSWPLIVHITSTDSSLRAILPKITVRLLSSAVNTVLLNEYTVGEDF